MTAVLSISKMGAGQAKYYLDLAREDYYLEGGEPPGRWMGSGVRSLRLPEKVERQHLKRLFAGQDPDIGVFMGQEQHYTDGRSRQPGWDCTFNAPKSVSVFWSQADEGTRAIIESAQRRAVSAAVGYLEDNAAWCRRGASGMELEKAKLVVATFEHGTSRAQDPHLHTHALVLNVAPREDATWGALVSRPLFRHKMAAGAVYRAELSLLLQMELGLRVELDHAQSFRLSDVPKSVVEFFSKRRAEILAAIHEFGSAHPKVADMLTLKTRTSKEHVARQKLFEQWQREGQDLGFGPKQANVLRGSPGPGTRAEFERAMFVAQGLVAGAVPGLLGFQSTYREARLVQAVAVQGQAHPVGAAVLRQAVQDYLTHDPEVVQIPGRDSDVQYTTRAVIDLERRMLAAAKRLHASSSHRRPFNQPLVGAFKHSLDADLGTALQGLLDQEGSLRVLSWVLELWPIQGLGRGRRGVEERPLQRHRMRYQRGRRAGVGEEPGVGAGAHRRRCAPREHDLPTGEGSLLPFHAEDGIGSASGSASRHYLGRRQRAARRHRHDA